MRILYVASEAAPFAATGGLGDVMGSLPTAIKKQMGDMADVRVVLPLYRCIKKVYFQHLTRVTEGTVHLSWRKQYVGIYSLVQQGITYYFLDNEYYFHREFLYGDFDDGERFSFFGKAVLEMMALVDFFPDILHANDWQSASCVIYLKRKYGLLARYSEIKTFYTIHNIEYQGNYPLSAMGDIFEWNEWDRSVVEYNGCINLTKGAIVCADRVGTVSRTYAEELKTDWYSCGLGPILRMFSYKMVGILNGIDTVRYDPENDPYLSDKYSLACPKGKKTEKAELQSLCGFPINEDIPIVAMVSRLAAHKGFDLVCHVLEEILTDNTVQICLLGTGERMLEEYFIGVAHRYPEQFHARIEFNSVIASKYFAGADMFLMPSRSEPCGLAQMIACRYGAVPIVRETGGLKDSIVPYNRFTGEGNGFSFTNYNAHDMKYVTEDALRMYRNRNVWKNLMRNAMSSDFSWDASAREYRGVYESLLKEDSGP